VEELQRLQLCLVCVLNATLGGQVRTHICPMSHICP
jgi:hypothetical protein